MKKLNLVFGILVAFGLTFTSCYKEDYYTDDFGNSFIEEGEHSHDDNHGHSHDFDDETIIASYEVDSDFIIKTGSSTHNTSWMNDEAKHQFMWEYFIKMVSPEQRPWITEFVVFDGEGEVYGYVEPTNDYDVTQWRFALAIDLAYVDGVLDKDGEYTNTLIHEFAHVISLNETQIDASANACSTFDIDEGCTYNDSYLNIFYQKYWTAIINDYNEAIDSDNGDDFYDQYQSHFVTDYAASNPVEDWAEVFTFFVELDAPPNSSTIANQKVNSFYDYPYLVSLRNSIRQGASVMPRAGSSKRSKQFKLRKVGSKTVFTK